MYDYSILPGAQLQAPPLVELGTFLSGSVTWNVNLAVGTLITIHVKDNVGRDGYSGKLSFPLITEDCLPLHMRICLICRLQELL
jgi:hypothetical protein